MLIDDNSKIQKKKKKKEKNRNNHNSEANHLIFSFCFQSLSSMFKCFFFAKLEW